MTKLDLVTHLGANAVPIAADLARRISADVGIEVVVHTTTADLPGALTGDHPVLSWMCGLLTTEMIDSRQIDAEIVAAPVFPEELGPVYHSVIIGRASDGPDDNPNANRLAINEAGSWSGHHALKVHLAESGRSDRTFSEVIETGSHEASIDMVIDGQADITSIDHTVWAHELAQDSRLSVLIVREHTRDWPAPPFSLSRGMGSALHEALLAALITVRPTGLDAIVAASGGDYDPIRRGMEVARLVTW